MPKMQSQFPRRKRKPKVPALITVIRVDGWDTALLIIWLSKHANFEAHIQCLANKVSGTLTEIKPIKK